MRLADVPFGNAGISPFKYACIRRERDTVEVWEETTGGYSIYICNERGDATGARWEWVDAFTAQCLLYELLGGNK